MIQERFYVSDDDRLTKVKHFIRSNMPTARFVSNPYKHGSGEWEISITYEKDDMNKLSTLINEFYNEDNPIKPKRGVFLRLADWLLNRTQSSAKLKK